MTARYIIGQAQNGGWYVMPPDGSDVLAAGTGEDCLRHVMQQIFPAQTQAPAGTTLPASHLTPQPGAQPPAPPAPAAAAVLQPAPVAPLTPPPPPPQQ